MVFTKNQENQGLEAYIGNEYIYPLCISLSLLYIDILAEYHYAAKEIYLLVAPKRNDFQAAAFEKCKAKMHSLRSALHDSIQCAPTLMRR